MDTDEVTFSDTSKGRKQLIFRNQIFWHFKTKPNGKNLWRSSKCSLAGCGKRKSWLTTGPDDQFLSLTKHKHGSNLCDQKPKLQEDEPIQQSLTNSYKLLKIFAKLSAKSNHDSLALNAKIQLIEAIHQSFRNLTLSPKMFAEQSAKPAPALEAKLQVVEATQLFRNPTLALKLFVELSAKSDDKSPALDAKLQVIEAMIRMLRNSTPEIMAELSTKLATLLKAKVQSLGAILKSSRSPHLALKKMFAKLPANNLDDYDIPALEAHLRVIEVLIQLNRNPFATLEKMFVELSAKSDDDFSALKAKLQVVEAMVSTTESPTDAKASDDLVGQSKTIGRARPKTLGSPNQVKTSNEKTSESESTDK